MGKIFDLNFYLDEVQRLCAEGMVVVEAVEKVKELKRSSNRKDRRKTHQKKS